MKGQAAQIEPGSSHSLAACDDEPPPILWNGVPFSPSAPPFRESKIVRLRRSPGYSSGFINASSVAASMVLTREYRITIISPTITLHIITNAPEAAEEFPDTITTRYRDTGTFCDAILTWRGREDRAFVSASLTEAPLAITNVGDKSEAGVDAALAAYASAARGAIRTGILVGGPNFTKGLTPDEIELANLLMTYRDEKTRAVYSYDEIGRLYGVNGETIRRYHKSLNRKHRELARIIKTFRARNTKCSALGDTAAAADDDEPDETDRDGE